MSKPKQSSCPYHSTRRSQTALNQTQRIQGFIHPLEQGSVIFCSCAPLTCSFCRRGWAREHGRYARKTPGKYGMRYCGRGEGQLLVLNDDSYDLYYRMTDATPIK
jgi:hypothetical protein